MNWCQYFQDIANEPLKKTPSITVRQLFEARDHYQECEICHHLIDNIKDEPDMNIGPSMSLN